MPGRHAIGPTAHSCHHDGMYDVIIVGAGPAGLSAALILGRSRRRVLVCDTGSPRNAASHAMHGFLSRDGIDPREFLRISREQLRAVRRRRAARRRGASRPSAAPTRGSKSQLADGDVLIARKLLIATGVVDNVPDIPGLRGALRPQRVSLPVLRRLGSARSAARDLRPRQSRPRTVARADRLEPRSRAVHGRAVRDRRRRPCAARAPGIRMREDRIVRLEGAGRQPRRASSSPSGERAAAPRAVLHDRPDRSSRSWPSGSAAR